MNDYWKEHNDRVERATNAWVANIDINFIKKNDPPIVDWEPDFDNPGYEIGCWMILFSTDYTPVHLHGVTFAEAFDFKDIYLEAYKEDSDEDMNGWNFCEEVTTKICEYLTKELNLSCDVYSGFGEGFYGLFLSREKEKEDEDGCD